MAADFYDRGGWGRQARGMAGALGRYTRVAQCNANPDLRPDHYPDDAADICWTNLPDPDGIAICLGSLDFLAHAPGKLRIMSTAWETSKVPEPHLRIIGNADRVWVPTDWGRILFEKAGIAPSRISVVPEGVNSRVFTPPQTRAIEACAHFRFLCVGKWEQRKGTADLVSAFCKEFKSSEAVELILQCWNPYIGGFDLNSEVARETRHLGNDLPRVVTGRPLPLPGLVALMQEADAFVLPTRAEGWGLPILEAMACGLPTIVTDYSGHRAFTNEANSYLIAVERMCPVDDPYFFHPAYDWGEWAQPDIAHLRHLMRHVFENREEALEKGRVARLDAERWSWDNAAQQALRCLPR